MIDGSNQRRNTLSGYRLPIATRGTVNDFNFPALHNEEFEITFAFGKEFLPDMKRSKDRELAQCRDLCIVEFGKRDWVMS